MHATLEETSDAETAIMAILDRILHDKCYSPTLAETIQDYDEIGWHEMAEEAYADAYRQAVDEYHASFIEEE